MLNVQTTPAEHKDDNRRSARTPCAAKEPSRSLWVGQTSRTICEPECLYREALLQASCRLRISLADMHAQYALVVTFPPHQPPGDSGTSAAPVAAFASSTVTVKLLKSADNNQETNRTCDSNRYQDRSLHGCWGSYYCTRSVYRSVSTT